MQHALKAKRLTMHKAKGSENTADMLTMYLDAVTLAKLMAFSDADELKMGTICVRDLHGFVVFNYNMLVRNYGGCELNGADMTPQALLASRDAVFGDYFPDHSQVFKSLCNEHICRDGRAALFARIDSWTKVPCGLSQLFEPNKHSEAKKNCDFSDIDTL